MGGRPPNPAARLPGWAVPTEIKAKEESTGTDKERLMATLLEQYSNSTSADFRTRLIMCLAKKLSTELGGISPGDPDNKYDRYVMIARKALDESQDAMDFVARVLAANDFSDANTDAELQTAIDANFDRISKMFDPTVG